MTLEPLQDKIQAYLDGTLPPAEKTAFEDQIKASESLAAELGRYRQLRILGQHQTLIQGKTMLDAVMAEVPITPDYGQHEAYFKKPLGKTTKGRWFLGGLAILTAVLGLFFYQKYQTGKALANLAQAQLSPMANMIGFAPDDPSNAAQAMRAYDQKNYAEAISGLSLEVQANPDDNSLRLYLAVCHLMQAQHPQAETLLREIIKTEDLATVPAKWYLALSLMQHNAPAEARTLLKSLEPDTIFGGRAKILLKAF